jgi:hypothetical protein
MADSAPAKGTKSKAIVPPERSSIIKEILRKRIPADKRMSSKEMTTIIKLSLLQNPINPTNKIIIANVKA